MNERDAPPADAPASVETPTPAVAPSHRWAEVREDMFQWLRTLFSAAIYAVLIITFVGQVARVEGSSMEPTLHDQDRLVVNKIAYRFHEPRVGDIVMHYYPIDPELTFVKRLIAGPGDVIEIRDGRVRRNGSLVDDDYVAEDLRSYDDFGPERVPDGHYFVMGDNRRHSLDSRSWDWLPERYIVGKVELRWWPLSDAQVFDD